ncbi:MAG: hypothetical protein SNJ70_06310, partial [Armatimonadota bacterium]
IIIKPFVKMGRGDKLLINGGRFAAIISSVNNRKCCKRKVIYNIYKYCSSQKSREKLPTLLFLLEG